MSTIRYLNPATAPDASAFDALYAPAHADARAALNNYPTPNYRAFCIAVLELRVNATPELLQALARRYHLLVDGPDGSLVENPEL
jgi:hypothetical protein